MPYLNLDDNYPDHPKIEALSDAAYRLHGAALFYAARFRLDGYLTRAQLRARRAWSTKTERELVDEWLLHAPGDLCESKHCPPDDGRRYRLHDFLQWNKPRAWWDEEREKAAKRKAEWKARQTEKEQGDGT
ncbi:MAG TPA: hypothetical protein VFJ19_09665 [Nocardioidaceae bacterium]|nr:hypothetical protein [Nocardioidaceae bacterium]